MKLLLIIILRYYFFSIKRKYLSRHFIPVYPQKSSPPLYHSYHNLFPGFISSCNTIKAFQQNLQLHFGVCHGKKWGKSPLTFAVNKYGKNCFWNTPISSAFCLSSGLMLLGLQKFIGTLLFEMWQLISVMWWLQRVRGWKSALNYNFTMSVSITKG